MTAIRVDVVVETDGQLVVRDLSFHKGDRVEAIVMIRNGADAQARQRFLARARTSQMQSHQPYPSREELHDRS